MIDDLGLCARPLLYNPSKQSREWHALHTVAPTRTDFHVTFDKP